VILIYSAIKRDQYLIELMLCCALSTHPWLKPSFNFCDRLWGGIWTVLYALAYNNSRPLPLYDLTLISYHGDIESRTPQTRIRKQRARTKVWQELCQRNWYVKKPNRMLGFFIVLNCSS